MMKKVFGIFSGILIAVNCSAELKIKTVKVPSVTVPAAAVPAVLTVSPELPATVSPSVTVPETIIPPDNIPETGIPMEQIPETGKIKTDEVLAYVPAVTDRNTPLVQGKAFTVVKKRLFRDQRGLVYDRTANSSNSAFMKWVKIFENYKEQEYPVFPMPEGIRMIAEVQTGKDLSRLPENLAFYRGKGYNSVLFVLTGKETPSEAETVCKIITDKEMKLFFAFSPEDHDGELSASVFPDPDSLSDLLRITALYAYGFLLHWRRTSSHYFIHDPAWDDWMIRTVRSGKKTLPILGEIYFGTNAESNGKVTLIKNAPSGTSGNVLNGGGFFGISASGLIRAGQKLSSQPLYALILGEKPRYLKNSGKSFADHLKIKRSLENKYLQYGCAGTITLHSDTSQDNIAEWLDR